MEVRLIDITSEPVKRIYRAYRICYSKDKYEDIEIPSINGHPDIEKMINFIKPLMDKGHCYDSETEVLTNYGFKKFTDIVEQDKFASIDPSNGMFIGFEEPKEVFSQNYEGKMHHYKHKNVDLLVTPHHKIYAKKYRNKNSNFKLVHSNDENIWNKPLVMVKGCNGKVKDVKTDYFMQLYGFFIGDGYSEAKNRISFHLKKERKIKYLKEIVAKIGLQLKVNKNDKYIVNLEGIGEKFRNNFYNEENEKTFPIGWIESLNENEVKNLWIGLLNSDGSYHHNSEVYCTSSSELNERLQAIMTINGMPCSSNESNGIFKVTKIMDRSKYPVFNDSRGIGKVTEVDYKGTIHCVTVSKGLLVVRRNNKIVLSGNTSPMEHVSFSFSIEGLSRAALAQLTRHRTFSFNVESMRYVDAKNFNFVVPELEYLEESKKEEMQETFRNMFQALKESYSDLIELGIKKEDARAILPQATTCNLIVTCDLHNFRNFLKQRLCVHAQQEIRELADEMNKLVKVQVPFVDYKVLRCQQGLCNECKSR